MEEYPAGQIEANGVTVPIFVDERGDWTAEYGGRIQAYPTREKLENRLKTLTRQATVRVEVPVVRVNLKYDGAEFTRATLTGIHGGNGNVIGVLHFGGRRGDVKEQFGRCYGSSEVFFGGDVTDEQLQEYAALRRAEYEARNAVRKAEKRFAVKDIKALVQRVIDVRAGGEGE